MFFKYDQPSAGILYDLIANNNNAFLNVPKSDLVLSSPGTSGSYATITVGMATDANAPTQYQGTQIVQYTKPDLGAYLGSSTPAYAITASSSGNADLLAAVNSRFMLALVNDASDPSGAELSYDNSTKVLTLTVPSANLFWSGSAQFNVIIPQPDAPITGLFSNTALYNNPLDPTLQSGQTFAEVRYGSAFHTNGADMENALMAMSVGQPATSGLTEGETWQIGVDMTGDAWQWSASVQPFNINGATVVYNGVIQAGTMEGVSNFSNVCVIALDGTYSNLVGNLVIPYNTVQSF